MSEHFLPRVGRGAQTGKGLSEWSRLGTSALHAPRLRWAACKLVSVVPSYVSLVPYRHLFPSDTQHSTLADPLSTRSFLCRLEKREDINKKDAIELHR
jgi:hypothetical protein